MPGEGLGGPWAQQGTGDRGLCLAAQRGLHGLQELLRLQEGFHPRVGHGSAGARSSVLVQVPSLPGGLRGSGSPPGAPARSRDITSIGGSIRSRCFCPSPSPSGPPVALQIAVLVISSPK